MIFAVVCGVVLAALVAGLWLTWRGRSASGSSGEPGGDVTGQRAGGRGEE